jgi:hypothetical protein
MEPYLLLVTLVLPQQAPHSYQVEFSSKEKCEKAAADLQASYYRMSRGAGVTAVCARK